MREVATCCPSVTDSHGVRPPRRRGADLRAAFLLVAAVALLAWFARPLWCGEVYTGGDLGTFHLPLRYFYGKCLQRGEPFDWIPDICGGLYLQGEGQVGMYHPLHLALYRFLPLPLAFDLELFLNYPFALAGLYLWLRRRGLPHDAALLGGLLSSFSGFAFGHHAHLNGMAIAAHAPWLLLALDRTLAEGPPRRRAVGQLALGLLTASEVLLGYPQYVLCNCLIEGAYLCFSLRKLRQVWDVGQAKVLGVLAGGVQLLPSWDALHASTRSTPPLEFRGLFSLHPLNVLQLVAGYYLRLDNRCEFLAFNGLLATVALVWLVLRRRRLGESWGPARFALAVAGLGAFFAVGKYNPLFPYYSGLPPFSTFRCPCRFVLLVHFAGAVGAAVLWTDLVRRSARKESVPWSHLLPLLLLPVLALLPVWLQPVIERIRQENYQPEPAYKLFRVLEPAVSTGVGLTAGLVALVLAAARGFRWALPVLLAWAVADQAVLMALVEKPRSTLTAFTEQEPGPPRAAAEPGARARVFQPALTNVLCLHDIPQVAGYVGLQPWKRLDYWKDTSLRVAGVSWKVLRPRGEWLPVAGGPLPRVRLVTGARVSFEANRDLDTIDPATTALVPGDLHLQPDEPPGTVTVGEDRPGRLVAHTEAGSRQLLVFAESFHPGWHAFIDGEREGVLPVYGDFLGCVVPAGRHTVVFAFQPRSLCYGVRLSLAALALLLGSFALTWFRRSGWKPDRPVRFPT